MFKHINFKSLSTKNVSHVKMDLKNFTQMFNFQVKLKPFSLIFSSDGKSENPSNVHKLSIHNCNLSSQRVHYLLSTFKAAYKAKIYRLFLTPWDSVCGEWSSPYCQQRICWKWSFKLVYWILIKCSCQLLQLTFFKNMSWVLIIWTTVHFYIFKNYSHLNLVVIIYKYKYIYIYCRDYEASSNFPRPRPVPSCKHSR